MAIPAAAVAFVVRQQLANLAWRCLRIVIVAVLGGVLTLVGGGCVAGMAFLSVMHIGGPGSTVAAGPNGSLVITIPNTPLDGGNVAAITAGAFVSDAQRYVLALNAGWRGEEALTAVAVSIAEDPSGNPAVISPTQDVGLWQINIPTWAAQFGGVDALKVPANNADAAFWIQQHRGWGQWTTYQKGLHNQYMKRAALAAELAVSPSPSAYTFPLPGWSGAINLHWGVASGGSDLFAPTGQPIVSVSSGTALEAGFERIGGNNVLIKGADGLSYYYAHMAATPLVGAGQPVRAGQPLGVVGNTGDAVNTPTHLHIGIGHSILTGADAQGGTGSGFDAVGFLRKLYAQAR